MIFRNRASEFTEDKRQNVSCFKTIGFFEFLIDFTFPKCDGHKYELYLYPKQLQILYRPNLLPRSFHLSSKCS